MIDQIGWLGSFLLGVCGIPLAWEAWRHRVAPGWAFLLTWLAGEVCLIIYTPWEYLPLHLNYWFNCGCIGVTIYFKRRKSQ
jgi:hypothetical protein